MNVREHLRLCEQNTKRLKGAIVDIKSRKKMAEKLKESMLVTLELKLLRATFRFKDIHLAYARNIGPARDNPKSEREINLTKSHFLEEDQTQALQDTTAREYK